MKKIFNRKNKIYRRIISFTLIFALMFTVIPVDLISEDILERAGVVTSVKAEGELDALKAKYTGHTYTFTSEEPDFSEYSQCFQDATWAGEHANDTITLLPASSKFIFDSNYNPIGNASAPFYGTIYLNTTTDDFYVETYSPIFDYVKDSVKVYKLGTTTVIPLNINRLADAGDTVSPLLAKHVVGSSATTPYEWKVILNSANAKSYSGVIYEMTDGAKVNLTFTDNSNHTPVLDNNGNISSGSIIDNKESGKNYGILCGSISGGSVLKSTYTNTNDDTITFIGTETAYCGGLIGEIKGTSTFELLSGSSAAKVDFQTPKNQVGFICGHAESSTITLPTGYAFEGTIDGNVYAGGIAGYCKNTVVSYESSTGNITLSDCEIKNGTTTGGVFGYYECDTLDNDILIDRTYSLSDCTVEGTGVSGGIAGEYKPTYSGAVTIDLDKYTLGSSISLNTGTSAGGLFGKYTSPGNVTITDSNTSNTHFAPPESSVPYGGIIGEYVNGSYSKTLTLSGFTVNNLSASASENVGGIIRVLNGSTYVDVSGVSVTNANVSSVELFGGIISTLDNSNAGSFIDLTGNFTLSLASGTYKGGAIAGSFKKGVVRFAGTTDISGAKAENGYAQLIYENDETLVYAKGSGSDLNWTLKRNVSTTASDLGQWGEVVRLFDVSGTLKNAEDAGIVSVSNNKVTVAQGVTNITDTVSFAKCALNMQLNDGSNHGALCFATGGANKTALLASTITVDGEIDLSGTGLLGFMRDGGNGKNISSNTFNNVEFFSGSISGKTGASTDKILLNVGEIYGCDASGTALTSTATGGRIYLAATNNGHDSQGLFAFAKAASVTNLTVGGNINVERKVNESSLYAGALFGAMTNGATLSGVTINTKIDVTKSGDKGFYIGGVSGIFDGNTGYANYTLSLASNCSIKPEIKLNGGIGSTYAGGILGYLDGAAATKYNVSVASSEISPKIEIGTGVADVETSYIGGMIGRIAANTTNARTVTLSTVTMTGASVETKSKYSGGLLGSHWERTNLTVNGLTITGSTVNSKYSAAGSLQSGLVFKGTGKWDINTLTIQKTSDTTPVDTTFKSTNGAPASFGLIVNEAYSGNDGLYINVKNSGYTLDGVTVPTSTATNYYVDEIAADTCSGDILAGGNGTGIVNINMNTVVNNVAGTATKITDVDSNSVENGTGTYQNKLSTLGNLIANQNSRYYYNLDVMMDNNHTKTDGEKFLLWSVNKYTASNIASNFSGAITGITDIDLSGLSYYPIPGGDVTLPTGATITFGFNAINDYENASRTPDGWSRNPDDVGNPNTANARNQHYLMQTGLFTTVTSLTADTLTLAGDFGYVEGVASGALINGSTSGAVALTGLTLDKLTPSNNNSYLLINYIDGTGDALPSLTVSNLRATNYNATGVSLPVAKSLFGKAQGQNMTMHFNNIKLDARNGDTISDSSWTAATNAASDMTTAYGTSRSIFSTATFFTELWAAKTSTLEYYYTVEEDWGSGSETRKVTYGKEVTDSREYNSGDGEKKYNMVGSGGRHYTNPISDCDTEFYFSAGFLPYVGNYTSKGTNATYPVNEIKVNFKVEGLVDGCGTYNDPYIISTAAQLNLIANAVNNGVTPGTIRLPNTMSIASSLPFAETWHTGENGDGLYNLSGSDYVKDDSNSSGLTTWTSALVRNYLASAYYVINADLTGTNSLPSTFEGIGKHSATANGNTVFHGVIVGKKSNGSAPTITNPSGNPLIYISNGSVVKNLNINVTANISKSLDRQGDDALYGYKPNNSTYKGAEYYGGVIGEIMGGDNIIDDVTVTYSGSTTLSGGSSKDYKHLIAEGGMVGCVVNGALIFRGTNSVSGRNVTSGGIYSNQFVGRVINGYAIYEKISTRIKATDVAPDNYNTCIVDEEDESKVTKTYTYSIDTIDRSNTNKLDVNYTAGTVTVPDAQSLYIMSLITQSIASTADKSSPYNYYKYSPSYGYNTDSGFQYINGVARLGDYSSVGCGTSAAKPDDYSDYAVFDSVNNYTNSSSKDGLMKAPIPYIIYKYTTRYGTTTTNPAADFPARRLTFDNSKFWDITLSSSNSFDTFGDNFKAFRGIGCAGLNSSFKQSNNSYGDNTVKTAFKVASFDGNGNTVKLHISLPRYQRNQDNYYHKQNISLTQNYSGMQLDSTNYGHDSYLELLMGLGLFDCVMVNNASDYQFKNVKLQGTIEDKVFNSSGNVVTGKNDQTQLFTVGGIVGKRIYGNNYDLGFKDITFDGLSVTGAFSCGGLIGTDAIKQAKKLEIAGCNSTANGISVIGGYYGKESDKIRHGIGSYVGMTFWCRPYIDGKTATSDTSNISVSNVSTFYSDNYPCSVGGIIGYTGSGAEIKNINLVAANGDAVIGGEKVFNAGGFIGFTQAMTENKNGGTNRTEPNADDLKDCVYIENCTIQNLTIKAKNGAGGFVSKTGNRDTWHTKYIYINNCAVIGDADNKPEIKAYGTGTATNTNCVGGFVGDLRSSVVTCLIQNSYIKDYTIEGWHVGGIIGETTYRSANLRNLYVKDCEIIRNNSGSGAIGGIVGYSNQDLNGYDLKIDGVIFKKKANSGYTESPSDAGIILGESNGTKINKFVGIGAYHTEVSKVPTAVVKTNGTNTGNFFVFADYLNASAADITAETSYASTFGNANNVDQPLAPYLNTAPHMGMGTDEYLTGDGASIGKAGEIYKDYKAGSSNRRYSVGTSAVTDSSVGNTPDGTTLQNYINNDGSYKNGAFKISTASAELGTLPTGIQNFAMLVINDDTDKTNDITPFIKSYIRLVTNAENSSNQYKNNQYAYSYGNNNIDNLYKVVVRPCYYDSSAGKYVLGDADDSGLKIQSDGKYEFVSANADSEAGNYQFSLIDVQFKDPTTPTISENATFYNNIAYHLYVPVYTKKMLTAEFSAVTMSATTYSRNPYANKIASEIAASKNRSILVESTNEWTTTFIRYTYPKNQITSADNWNFDKSIILNFDNNFSALPEGTELILVDPNANSDKYYRLTLDGSYPTGTDITLSLTSFEDESGTPFEPQNLSAILADQGAWGTGEGHTNELYEDYYISIYVPNKTTGQTHGVRIDSGSLMTYTGGGDTQKANIDKLLYSYVVLGDLFTHSITQNSFVVTSGDGNTLWGDNREMTNVNKVLKTDVTATVQIKNLAAGAYLSNSDVYHAFYLTLTSHDASGKVSDIIYGITPGYVHNETTLTYTDSEGPHTETSTHSYLGANYVYLNSGSIRDALMDPTLMPTITIHSVTTMIFNDITAFPFNPSGNNNTKIGTQVSVKSSVAYREEDLRYSALNSVAEDPDGYRYYSTTQNSAQLSFNAVPTDDTTDEIGYKTNNRSLLGVNGKYGTQHPIIGKAIYNVDDIIDYNSAENVVYTITLYKKVTNGSVTRYQQVSDISNYLSNVNLTDSNSEVTLEADITDPDTYVYTGAITHGSQLDLDKMFEVDFSCTVLTGDSTHNEYANYKVVLTADLDGATNAWKDSYLVYTNAKFDPSVIDE